MHDIDRALFEMEQGEATGGGRGGSVRDGYELELATELLEVTSEAELDRFLGDVLKKAVTAGKAFAASDTGKAVGGLLKGVAKNALPQLGRLVTDLASGQGAQTGSEPGASLAGELALEWEGLSQEDREFEAARAFANFANETAANAATAPPSVSPTAAATRAATTAAKDHMPGLVPLIKELSPPAQFQQRGWPQTGRWERSGREGRNLIAHNVFPPMSTPSGGSRNV